MDTLYLQRANARYTDNNAKAYYDCIIPLILLLAYVKAGLPYTAAVFFSILLYNMKYYITTAFKFAPLSSAFGLFAVVYRIRQGSTDGLL
eukprot:9745022-Ditylum_brightwellii.AAC.1